MLELDDIQHFLLARPRTRAALRVPHLLAAGPGAASLAVGHHRPCGSLPRDRLWPTRFAVVTVAFTWKGFRAWGRCHRPVDVSGGVPARDGGARSNPRRDGRDSSRPPGWRPCHSGPSCDCDPVRTGRGRGGSAAFASTSSTRHSLRVLRARQPLRLPGRGGFLDTRSQGDSTARHDSLKQFWKNLATAT
jgi:hypothetical protein